MNTYFRIENFLSLQENQAILGWAFKNENMFSKSSVTTKVDNYRRSRVAHTFPVRDYVITKLVDLLPLIAEILELNFDMGVIESQITASNDGDYFKIHMDCSQDCPQRVLTYIYYFHNQPKTFTGGELAIYSHDSTTLIEPANNSLICFPSVCLHEVLTVQCPSKIFSDGRFTLNGWINCK